MKDDESLAQFIETLCTTCRACPNLISLTPDTEDCEKCANTKKRQITHISGDASSSAIPEKRSKTPGSAEKINIKQEVATSTTTANSAVDGFGNANNSTQVTSTVSTASSNSLTLTSTSTSSASTTKTNQNHMNSQQSQLQQQQHSMVSSVKQQHLNNHTIITSSISNNNNNAVISGTQSLATVNGTNNSLVTNVLIKTEPNTNNTTNGIQVRWFQRYTFLKIIIYLLIISHVFDFRPHHQFKL